MVKVTVEKNHVVFDVVGFHKLWSFKDRIRVPKEHIEKVHNNIRPFSFWKGLRLPGTYFPFVITAGTYYKRGGKNFWDVVKERNAIVVQLKDEKYKNLIIEVENPEETMAQLNEAAAQNETA
jgi:hypothetical protein